MRWSVDLAGAEFGLDRRTVAKRLAQASIAPDTDGKFSTKQIVTAVFSDAMRERQRLVKAQADLAEHQLAERQQQLFPKEMVMRVQGTIFANIRNRILASNLTTQEQSELFAELHESVISAADAELAHLKQ